MFETIHIVFHQVLSRKKLGKVPVDASIIGRNKLFDLILGHFWAVVTVGAKNSKYWEQLHCSGFGESGSNTFLSLVMTQK